MSTQPTLFALPRRLEPGDEGVCLDCREISPGGSWGPPGPAEITLSDGSAYQVDLSTQWLCFLCGEKRRQDRAVEPARLAERRRRMLAFRSAEALGYRGGAKFAIAEGWLRAGLDLPSRLTDAREPRWIAAGGAQETKAAMYEDRSTPAPAAGQAPMCALPFTTTIGGAS